MRHFLQIVIVIAVLFSNIRWQWTPNGYLAGIIAGLAAWMITVMPFKLFRGISALVLKLKTRFGHQKLDSRIPYRRRAVQGRR